MIGGLRVIYATGMLSPFHCTISIAFPFLSWSAEWCTPLVRSVEILILNFYHNRYFFVIGERIKNLISKFLHVY